MHKTHITLLVITILFLCCTQHDYNQTLIKYLKAEKDLRTRITAEQGLGDSIQVLQQHYHIDVERELSKLKDNPETWLKLVKELKIEE